MNWLDQAERRFGSLAVPHLLRYVAALNGLVFVLCQLKPAFIKALELDPAAVLQGEVWRLVSHLFIPLFGGLLPSWLGAAFYLLFLVWLGDGLEEAMGVFRLNVYYALGALGTTVAGFILGDGAGGFLLNNSLVFAFAWHYPTLQVYMFFIIPLRIKWLAIFDAAILAISPQDVASHEKFRAKHGFDFPLLADTDKTVGALYGTLGPIGFYRRSVFVIDGTGVVRYAHRAIAGLTYRPASELVEAVKAARSE